MEQKSVQTAGNKPTKNPGFQRESAPVKKLDPNRVGVKGHVKVIKGRQDFRFVGLFVPSSNPDGTLTNRFLVADRRCPEWFTKLCSSIVNGDEDEDMRLMVRVVSNYGPGLAYARPVAKSLEEARAAWSDYISAVSDRPHSFDEVRTDKHLCRLSYSRALELHNMSLEKPCHAISWSAGRVEAPYEAALIENHKSLVFRLEGAMDILKCKNQLAQGVLSFDDVVREYVKIKRIVRMSDL